jgi:hypothetical protein
MQLWAMQHQTWFLGSREGKKVSFSACDGRSGSWAHAACKLLGALSARGSFPPGRSLMG